MEPQNQEIVASGSPAEVPNDPGKMFIGGLSWQTSPGEFSTITVNHRRASESSRLGRSPYSSKSINVIKRKPSRSPHLIYRGKCVSFFPLQTRKSKPKPKIR
ncbi:uncharacterized protein LOC116175600 [Photinus pyralis]|uniref:uncharacterized protein LOC116175600 n=1 Tax=Photinus pyralis TaxID=7054 RepID=UPI0012674649|nr:uncharacterized protein LOC116175600 [Photinus pyralis]